MRKTKEKIAKSKKLIELTTMQVTNRSKLMSFEEAKTNKHKNLDTALALKYL